MIWIGNSYGSSLGGSSARKYPQDWNAYILTGYSKFVLPSLIGAPLAGPRPAAKAYPARFGDLPPGYIIYTIDPAITFAFFGLPKQVDYDPVVARLFNERKDAIAFGQFVWTYLPRQTTPAPAYTSRVFILTGEQDQAYCGRGGIIPAKCGSKLKESGSLFPNADYNWLSIGRTGHATELHDSAQDVYAIAHRFLAGETFRGGPPA